MQKIYLQKENLYGRPEITEYLEELKNNNPNFTLIDIGAAWDPVNEKFLTHTFDINSFSNHPLKNVHSFRGNINDYEDWIQIFEYVEKHGKFDFCNCTHTLEDLAYPQAALKYIPRIAKEGFIAVPSKYYELQRRQAFRGAVHHRWIFTHTDTNVLIGMPKLNVIDYIKKFSENEEEINKYGELELRLWWKDSIDFHIMNNDYMGPTFEAVVQMYQNIY